MNGRAAKGFPWLIHRTLEQVARTDTPQEKLKTGPLIALEAEELSLMLTKKLRHNPPPPPDQPA